MPVLLVVGGREHRLLRMRGVTFPMIQFVHTIWLRALVLLTKMVWTVKDSVPFRRTDFILNHFAKVVEGEVTWLFLLLLRLDLFGFDFG